MGLKLFYHPLSQPSRSLYIFLKYNNIPFEARVVDLKEGEHLTQEFKEKFNRFQKVPFIHDDNFVLSESIAIIRYLASKYEIKDNLYPSNFKQRALIDEYLEWQHHNTRQHFAMFTQHLWFIPLRTGTPADQKEVEKYEKALQETLDKIENLWLGNNSYLCGHKISVADLFAACEIEEPRLGGYDPTKGRPKIKEWLERVRTELNPAYAEAHAALNEVASLHKI
ncbi:hypothetical protein WA026_000074 [Henosepilachna vigintioctopunctata]|uniref:Glutathione S-transferase n=1 Tax=Henosepilachna vigintioctopunctata TaxID=420089 RepID=A0AAW1V785_9CUCU